jgi:hypothetical protein
MDLSRVAAWSKAHHKIRHLSSCVPKDFLLITADKHLESFLFRHGTLNSVYLTFQIFSERPTASLPRIPDFGHIVDIQHDPNLPPELGYQRFWSHICCKPLAREHMKT